MSLFSGGRFLLRGCVRINTHIALAWRVVSGPASDLRIDALTDEIFCVLTCLVRSCVIKGGPQPWAVSLSCCSLNRLNTLTQAVCNSSEKSLHALWLAATLCDVTNRARADAGEKFGGKPFSWRQKLGADINLWYQIKAFLKMIKPTPAWTITQLWKSIKQTDISYWNKPVWLIYPIVHKWETRFRKWNYNMLKYPK